MAAPVPVSPFAGTNKKKQTPFAPAAGTPPAGMTASPVSTTSGGVQPLPGDVTHNPAYAPVSTTSGGVQPVAPVEQPNAPRAAQIPKNPAPGTGSEIWTGYGADPYASTRTSPGAPAGAGTTTTGGTTTTASSALLAEPGAYEQWLKANMGKLDAPTRQETAYDSGLFDPLKTSAIGGVGPVAQTGYSYGPMGTSDYSAQVLGGLSGGPSGGPSVGASQGVLSSIYGPTGGPTVGYSSDVLGSLPTGPSNASVIYGDARDQLSTKGALEQRYDEMGASFNTPGSYEDWYSRFGSDPMNQSYTEQLYESGLGHLDPYYDYASKRAIAQAQNASAARGGFNSGLAAQQESDILSSLRGQQAKDWVALAPVADAARRARYDQGANFASTNQSAYGQRIKDAFGLSQAAQNAEEGRYKALSDIAGAGDAADTARANTRVSAAANADDANIGAFAAEWSARNASDANRVSAAGNADDANVGAFSAEWNARNNAEQNKISAAANSDQAAIDRFRAESDAAYKNGQLSLEQFRANMELANSQDSTTRNNINAIYNAGGTADASTIGRLLTQGGMAKDLQSTGQDRILGGLDAISGQSTREAALAQNIYNDMSSINSLDDVSLQALADKYGISLQKMKDLASAAGQGVGALVKILTS